MKNLWIIGGLMGIAPLASAQFDNPTGVQTTASSLRIGGTGAITKTLHLGDALGSLHSGTNGLMMKFTTGDRALLELHAPTGNHFLIIQALANANYISSNLGQPLYIQSTGGRTGFGNTSPAYVMDVTATGANDGIRVNQTGTGSGAVNIANTNTGGNTWSLRSSGSADAGGAGHLNFYNTNLGVDQMVLRSNGDVGVGITPSAKIHALGTTVGVRGDVNPGTGVNATAVAANANGNGSSGYMAGVAGRANGGTTNTGGYFSGLGGAAGITAYGVYAEVFNPAGGGNSYGIYATVAGSPNNGGAGPYWAGYFNGDVVTAQGSYLFSDRRIKKDVAAIQNSMDLIRKLNPVTYNFNTESNPDLALSSEKQYGFISQEIKEILPEFTKAVINPAKVNEEGKEIYPAKEILALNYNGFIALLTKGIQEQQKSIEDLTGTVATQQKQINEQKALINALMEKIGTATGINQTSGAAEGFNLEQNIPNPFNGETRINYTLPAQYKSATLTVYDLSGKQVSSFSLTEKGASFITITSEKLSAGIYIYSVIADGKLLDSKRMVVTEKQ